MNSRSVLSFFGVSAAVLLLVPCLALASETATGSTEDVWSAAVPVGHTEVSVSMMPLSIEIDQDQPSGPVYMAGFSQGDLAQSFQQEHGNIAGAGVLLQTAIGSTDNVNIAVWDGLPNAGGVMIVDAVDSGTAGSWVDVYWPAEMITPGTTYYLVFTGNTTLGLSGDTSNPYPNGHVYANSGFTPFTGFDYAFRTYYDTEVSLQRETWAGVKSYFE